MRYPTPLPPEPSGNSKETTWFRQLLKNIRERSLRVGPGLRISYGVDGTLIEIAKLPEAAASSTPAEGVRRFRIHTVASTYVEAYAYEDDGETLGTELFQVALQPAHRANYYFSLIEAGFEFEGLGNVSPVGAQSADFMGFTLFPPVENGKDIYAARATGKTDQFASLGIEWIDLTSRWLMPSMQAVNVCRLEGGVNTTRRILIAGGAIH